MDWKIWGTNIADTRRVQTKNRKQNRQPCFSFDPLLNEQTANIIQRTTALCIQTKQLPVVSVKIAFLELWVFTTNKQEH